MNLFRTEIHFGELLYFGVIFLQTGEFDLYIYILLYIHIHIAKMSAAAARECTVRVLTEKKLLFQIKACSEVFYGSQI